MTPILKIGRTDYIGEQWIRWVFIDRVGGKIEETACPLPKMIQLLTTRYVSVYCFFILEILLTDIFDEGYQWWCKGIPAEQLP